MISLRLLLAFALLALAPDATAQTGASARAAEAIRLAGIARQESALGRHQSALSHYVRAIAGDPDNVTILSAAGEEALLVGDSDAAFGFLGRAVTLSPRDPRVRAAYGRALVMSARPKDALTLFRQAVDLGMLEGAVAGDRGLARDLLGDSRKAQRDYRLALTARPGDPVVTQRLGLSLAISGERAAALALVQPLARGQTEGNAVRTLAFIHALTGDVASARRLALSSMGAEEADAYTPFFARLALLNAENKAMAVHLGRLPQSRRKPEEAAVPLSVKMPKGDPVSMRAAAHGHAAPEIGPRSADTPAPAPAERVTKASPPQAVAASPCDALSGRAKTRCEANERALARRCASGRRTAECVEYAARRTVSNEGKAKLAEAAPPPSTTPPPVADPCAGLSGARAVQCRADTRALDRRCGGPNPQKTAECLAYARTRTGAEPAKAVERHWVQIASGRNEDDMPREWARLKAKAPAVLARRTPYVAAASGTNRLLIGPFDSLSAARDVVNRLSGVGISTFPWTSPAGEDVDKLAVK